VKLGFTNTAKQAALGLTGPAYGPLTSAHEIESGDTLERSDVLAPKMEAEIAFLLKAPLSGVITQEEALSAVEAMAPALELADSRYITSVFNIHHVVADGANACRFITGGWQEPTEELGALTVHLIVDGEEVSAGVSSAILGHPLQALVTAAAMAEEQSESLQPGWVIMAGAVTEQPKIPDVGTIEVAIEGFRSAVLTIR